MKLKEIDDFFRCQSEKFESVDSFLNELANFHPQGPDRFHYELEEAINLITKGDHYRFFFTDRDGTLKSYACSYQTSIQPAYAGVIQGIFAQRCVQYAAVLTSAPLLYPGILDVSVMPPGAFCYGASGKS